MDIALLGFLVFVAGPVLLLGILATVALLIENEREISFE